MTEIAPLDRFHLPPGPGRMRIDRLREHIGAEVRCVDIAAPFGGGSETEYDCLHRGRVMHRTTLSGAGLAEQHRSDS